MLSLVLTLVACHSTPESRGACVWNQAYQENTQADSVQDILSGAQDCYVLVDPFDSVEAREAIGEIKSGGNTVGCYVSVGTCEEWREDFEEISPYCVAEQWGQWPGEYFVDTTSPELLAAMTARVDTMAGWGCDMVEFDNMDWAFDDGARTRYGFSASAEEAIAYNQALCDQVHAQGMGCMAKNTREGAEGFDGGTFESNPEEPDWWEHKHLQSFLDEGALGVVFHYGESSPRACDRALSDYLDAYGDQVSWLCEDVDAKGYLH